MVKLFVMIPRAPRVTPQEFHDHWRHPHATLGRGLSGLSEFGQSHQFDLGQLGSDQSYFEGIGEAWFGSFGEAAGMAADPHYTSQVQPDEVNFIDLPKLEYLFTTEEVLVDRATVDDGISAIDAEWSERTHPTCVKVLQFVRADGNPDWASSADRELGRRVGALRHVRARTLDEAALGEAAYRGVRELWWPTLWNLQGGISGDREAWDELLALGGPTSLTLAAVFERWPQVSSTGKDAER